MNELKPFYWRYWGLQQDVSGQKTLHTWETIWCTDWSLVKCPSCRKTLGSDFYKMGYRNGTKRKYAFATHSCGTILRAYDQ